MEKNVGGIDQKIRLALGIVLIPVGLLAPLALPWKIGIVIIGAVALITGWSGL